MLERREESNTPGDIELPNFEAQSALFSENPRSSCFDIPDSERDANPNVLAGTRMAGVVEMNVRECVETWSCADVVSGKHLRQLMSELGATTTLSPEQYENGEADANP